MRVAPHAHTTPNTRGVKERRLQARRRPRSRSVYHTAMLAELYNEVGPTAYALAARIVGDPVLAEEIVASTFASLSHRLDRADPPSASRLLLMVRARSIVRHHEDRIKGGYDRTRDLSATEIPLPVSGYESTPPSPGVVRRVRRRLGELPEASREAIELVFFEGLTDVDLTVRLGGSIGRDSSPAGPGRARSRCRWRRPHEVQRSSHASRAPCEALRAHRRV